ncbi:UNVERIFIED_CONTAM: hypothetical protein Scaly_0667100 [Sesamum calycinum]|uniref:Uncharacterized protein n=1 Tax=Sesamum calycinum TaxID=2727403 RepID=A0AAW2RUR2_9LAMI
MSWLMVQPPSLHWKSSLPSITKPLAIISCHSHHLLAARSPPHMEFPHAEFFQPDLPVLGPSGIQLQNRSFGGAKLCQMTPIKYNKDRVSTLLNAADLKSRVNPPLPDSYCSNAVLVTYSSATCEDLEKWRFSKLVEMVSEGPKRVTDEYVRSVIDWLEINKGLPCGSIW